MSSILKRLNITDTSTGLLATFDKDDILIKDGIILIFQWVVYTVVWQLLIVFGIGTNIINIICFIKQGFKDPINVSLLGLAISDLCSLATLIWGSICYNPGFIQADLSFNTLEIAYLTSGIPHTTFTRVTGWITALITLERCLCITSPLKVSSIVTSQRVGVVIACVFILFLASVAPVYVVNSFGEKYIPGSNITITGLVFTGDRERVETVSFVINNSLVPFSAFIVITVCTIILVVKLRSITKWRQTATTNTQNDNVSSRNQKAAKMVVMISSLFIACFVPLCIIFIAMSSERKLSVDGKYRNVLTLLGGCGIVLETVNLSVNIFIYYHMSSKYRITFRQLFDKSNDSFKSGARQ